MGRDGPIGLFGLLFRQEVDNENTPETGGGTNWLRLTEIPKKNRNILLKVRFHHIHIDLSSFASFDINYTYSLYHFFVVLKSDIVTFYRC